MRAWVPSLNPTSLLRCGSVDEPSPGSAEVLIAVEAFSPNRGEKYLLEHPRPGWRPGKDLAGLVIAAGAEVDTFRVGDRVVAHPESGGWSELVAVPADRVALLPDDISSITAAALPMSGLTALRVLRIAGLLAGQRVLLTGASGGVGHFLVEMAAAQGALVTAVTASSERGERLLALGATEVVRDVNAASGTFDVAIESVGGDTLSAAWSRLTTRGLLIWLGQASRTPITLDFFDWSGAESGSLRKFSYADSDVPYAADLATLVRLVHRGHLHPEVGQVCAWSDTPVAIADLIGRKVRGSVVVTVDR